jgi:hypothetical protein
MNPGWTVLLDLASAREKQALPRPLPAAGGMKHQAPPSPRAQPQGREEQPEPPQPLKPPKHLQNPRRQPLQDDGDEGMWPDDSRSSVQYYDAQDGCRLATAPSHSKRIRSSWAEGLFMDSKDGRGIKKSGFDACCEHLYCFADDCGAFDDSTCKKKPTACSRRQCEGGDPSPASETPSDSGCTTIPGRLICGQDCGGKYTCYDQETCSKVDGAGEKDKVYVPDLRTCCVDLTNLNGYPRGGEDDPAYAAHKMCEKVLKHRVTDYEKQDPSGPGGYKDRTEFPDRR